MPLSHCILPNLLLLKMFSYNSKKERGNA